MDSRDVQVRTSVRSSARTLWVWWVLATVLGGEIALILSVLPFAGSTLTSLSDYAGIFWVILMLILIGPVVGIAQGLVLVRSLRVSHWGPWPFITSIGILISVVVFTTEKTAFHSEDPSLDLIAAYFWLGVAGMLLGFLQWCILGRYSRGAGWWIPASGLAFIVSGFVGQLVFAADSSVAKSTLPLFPFGAIVAYGAPWALTLAIYAAITGLVLVRFAQRLTMGTQGHGIGGAKGPGAIRRVPITMYHTREVGSLRGDSPS